MNSLSLEEYDHWYNPRAHHGWLDFKLPRAFEKRRRSHNPQAHAQSDAISPVLKVSKMNIVGKHCALSVAGTIGKNHDATLSIMICAIKLATEALKLLQRDRYDLLSPITVMYAVVR